jgi:ABC-type lipoprotein release transport system permease subunit
MRMLAATIPSFPGEDPLMVGAIAALLSGVAVMASWIPARRAARVDPVIALRSE